MKKLKYADQLLTPEWKAKRESILRRDKFTCTKCKSKKILQVHHKYYEDGKMAWEYPDSCLTTLCSGCHKKIHEIKEIKIRRPPQLSHDQKNANRIKKMKAKLSQRDKLLQDRYDNIRKT